jgi:hypothetical protein
VPLWCGRHRVSLPYHSQRGTKAGRRGGVEPIRDVAASCRLAPTQPDDREPARARWRGGTPGQGAGGAGRAAAWRCGQEVAPPGDSVVTLAAIASPHLPGNNNVPHGSTVAGQCFTASGGGGTRTPKGFHPADFESAALPVRLRLQHPGTARMKFCYGHRGDRI